MDEYWRAHWTEKAALPSELAVGGRPSNRPSEFLHMISSIARGLKLSRQDVLLDAGCANGLVALSLAPWVREIWACDYVLAMASQARSIQNGTRNVHVVAADIRQLPFRSPMFSRSLMIGVVQHLIDFAQVQLALRGLHQVLQRGGALWMGWVPDADKKEDYLSQVERLDADEETKQRIRDRNNSTLWFTRDDLTQLGHAAGFQVHIQNVYGGMWQASLMFDAILTK